MHTDRPQYGYCMSVAATLAKRLGHKTISVIEFGVAGGNGLVSAERHAKEISREHGIEFQIYGFDGGVGLPPPEDYRDLPNLWQPGFYAMDEAALRKRLKISHWSSAKSAIHVLVSSLTYSCAHRLHLLGSGFLFSQLMLSPFCRRPQYFLPRVWTYFDDIIGEEHSDFTGERLAIAEYNNRSPSVKFSPDCYLKFQPVPQVWKDQIFVHHNFAHPDYCTFVGPENQQKHLHS